MKAEKEIWVDSYYFPEKYLVSNLGRVVNKMTKKIMKIGLDGHKKYKYLILAHKGKRKGCRLHRLVYLSFYPNTDTKLDIHHIDHNIYNNKLSNLDPIDRKSHSSMHAIISGKRPPLSFLSGKNHPFFKGRIIAIDVLTKKITHIFFGEKEIKLNSNFSHRRVYDIVNGKGTSHKGFFFERIANDLNIKIGDIYDSSKEA